MTNYCLSDRWRMCERGGHTIFLDIDREKYLALAPVDAARFHTVLKNSDIDSETAEFAKSLEKEGLLIHKDGSEPYPRSIRVEEASSMCWNEDEIPDWLSRKDLFNFILSWMYAFVTLKLLPLGVVARRVQRRKDGAKRNDATVDAEEVRARCRVFFLMHPVFTRLNHAPLLRSLTLIEFLARYEIYPTWVFGVSTQPFSARSWVQYDKMVLDDTPESVSSFTPIMAL